MTDKLFELMVAAADFLFLFYILYFPIRMLNGLNEWLKKRGKNGEKDQQNKTIK